MFAPSTYVARRHNLASSIGSGLIVLPGNSLLGMNYQANTYPFRQDGSFLYFAGLNIPDLLLLLDCDSGQTCLFGPALGLEHEIWSGPAPSLDTLAAQAGLDCAKPLDQAQAHCAAAQNQGRPIHYLPTYQGEQTLRLAHLLGRSPEQIEHGTSLELIQSVVALRSIKSAEEVAEIRLAIALSAQLYDELLQCCRPGLSEVELYAHLQGLILAQGAHEAFPTILTRRGAVLHNHSRDQILAQGDLLLVDSGVCSKLGYASDITRTLPVSGQFSTQQREIYTLVLNAQTAALGQMAPGVPFVDCHLAAAKTMVQGLIAVGLMHGDPDEAVAAGAHALFFPHGLGHMLGLDVHDMESLGEDHVGYDHEFKRSTQFGLSGLRLARRLAPGFVLTVEPGIYFIPPLIARWQAQGRHQDFINYPAVSKYLDFGGIRIEDDILITDIGAENLSSAITKDADESCAKMDAPTLTSA